MPHLALAQLVTVEFAGSRNTARGQVSLILCRITIIIFLGQVSLIHGPAVGATSVARKPQILVLGPNQNPRRDTGGGDHHHPQPQRRRREQEQQRNRRELSVGSKARNHSSSEVRRRGPDNFLSWSPLFTRTDETWRTFAEACSSQVGTFSRRRIASKDGGRASGAGAGTST